MHEDNAAQSFSDERTARSQGKGDKRRKLLLERKSNAACWARNEIGTGEGRRSCRRSSRHGKAEWSWHCIGKSIVYEEEIDLTKACHIARSERRGHLLSGCTAGATKERRRKDAGWARRSEIVLSSIISSSYFRPKNRTSD